VKRMLIYILAFQPLLVIAFLTYQQYGFNQFGDPVEYYKNKQEIMQALEDSLMALETVFSPENVGDSTMVAMSMHSRIFGETLEYDRQMTEVRAALDSLQREKASLVDLSNDVNRRQAILDDLKKRALDEKIIKLSLIYDGMKAPQSVPLFIEMSDTLAVLIMSNMQGRNASKLLGSIAEQDIGKATRITKLLAMMGIVKLD